MEPEPEFGRLPMFPLQAPFLPGEDLPLQIFEPRYAEMVRDCMRDNNPRFGTVLISQGREVATLTPDARLVPLPGDAHHPWRGDASGTGAAIASALGLGTGQGVRALSSAQSLTAREREVLTLVARGFGDSDIAEQLVLSTHTVHRHVANIRGKLNLPSRAAAAAFAVRAGLE